MNQFFCTVGEKLSNDKPETENPLLNDEYIVNPKNATFSFTPVTPKQLIETMGKFKTSQGSGLDCISSFFLKVGMPVLAGSLSRLFNMSMSLGIFPDEWKIARVTPTYKDAQKTRIQTIALCPFYRSSLVFLKNWFMINFTAF